MSIEEWRAAIVEALEAAREAKALLEQAQRSLASAGRIYIGYLDEGDDALAEIGLGRLRDRVAEEAAAERAYSAAAAACGEISDARPRWGEQ